MMKPAVIKKIASVVLACLCLSTPALADGFSDAMQAYDGKQYAKALRLLNDVANDGHVKAQYNIGLMHLNAQGTRQDNELAFSWFLKAANQGHSKAQNHVAAMYEKGIGVGNDYEKAAHWYVQAAERGYALAQRNLGNLYYRGLGVAQDDKLALKWLRRSASSGNASANYDVGVIYYQGLSAKLDYEMAHWHFKKAAAKKHAGAFFTLGAMYAKGRGVEKDLIEACKWWYLADKGGIAKAKEKLASIEKELSADDLEKAKRLAQNWEPGS